MSVRQDVVNLLVNVGGDKAKDQLNQLRKEAAGLNSEMKGLKKTSQEYTDKAKKLEEVNRSMSKLRGEIGLTSLSLKELYAEQKKLAAMQSFAVPGTKEAKELNKQLTEVKNRIYEVKTGTSGFGATLHKLKDELKGVGMAAIAYLGFQFVTDSFRKIIKGTAKVTDELSDLRRVTGMTAIEANNLNKSLGTMDTRTNNSGLRKIAIIAGKLGVAKDQILDFTKAVDMLVVSLGDELGDADTITTQLGKILNVFDGKVTGDNISKLGNAIVELANAGVASGGFITDFAQRVSGIAKASNLSLGSTVGLAAGFEELGLRSESSSTALQKLLSTIAGDIPTAARIANMNVAEFNELFSKSPQEALIKYAEGLTKNKKSFSEITASFKDAGEEGARVVQTLQAIGQRGDFLREKMLLANKATQETNAINDAYAIKNVNLASTIDKISKQLAAMANSKVVEAFLTPLINGFATLIGAVDKTKSSLEQFREQQSKVATLEKDMVPLINRYEQLNTKATTLGGVSKLAKTEQIELNNAINRIAADIPYAVTQYDNMGKAIGINITKAREFISMQKNILKYKNQDAISDTKNEIKRLQQKLNLGNADLKNQKQSLDYHMMIYKASGYLAPSGAGVEKDPAKFFEKANRDIAKSVEYIANINSLIAGAQGALKNLNGEILDNIDLTKTQAETAISSSSTVITEKTKEEIAAEKKASERRQEALDKKHTQEVDAYQKLLDKIKELEQEATLAKMDNDDAEIERIRIKYKILLDQAKGHVEAISRIEQLQANEISAYREKNMGLTRLSIQPLELTPSLPKGVPLDQSWLDRLPWSKANKEKKKKENKEKLELAIANAKEVGDGLLNIQNGFANLANQRENRQLSEEEKRNEAKKDSFRKMLEAKKISQKQYDAEINKLDEEMDARKRQIAIRQANRAKALAITQILIDTALGVANIWSRHAANPITATILTGIQALAMGLQLATVMKQEIPEAERGMLIDGKRHSEGGTLIEAEQGEMILSRQTVMNNPELSSQLLYNSQHRNGARIGYQWSQPQLSGQSSTFNTTTSSQATTAKSSTASNTDALLMKLIAEQQHNNALLATMPTNLKASISLSSIHYADELMQQIKKESGLKQ